MSEQKAWVWHGVLVDYTAGMIVAKGEDPADAIEAARADDDVPAYVVREMDPSEAKELETCEYVFGGG